jgi:cholera toxin transcriptional activator
MLNYRVVIIAMPTPEESRGKVVRFGAFEVDLISGELRKNGTRIRLQEQPFRILAMLLERPGEMVAREDLRSKLWPSDTFVDFDHGLNTAVNKLRESLGDAAANPRFVQTVARRGYRFIAPVKMNGSLPPPTVTDVPAHAPATLQGSAGVSPAITPGVPIPPHAAPSGTAIELHPELEIPVPHRGVTRGLFILIQIMYLIFYLAALFRWSEVHRIADSFLPGWGATGIVSAVLVTAGIGIPLRCYLISGAAFDYLRLGEKFHRLYPVILLIDELWAIAPFLLAAKVGFGAAFAATAGLLYLPFSERSLIRMAYASSQRPVAGSQ